METRRMRRLQHDQFRRTVVAWTCVCVIGLGVGLMLPRSTGLAVLMLVGALAGLGGLALRTRPRSPLPKLSLPAHPVRSRIDPVPLDRFETSPPHSGVSVRHSGEGPRAQPLRDLDEGDGDAAVAT